MKKNLTKLVILLSIPFSLIGCNKKKEEPVTDQNESTIIKDAKNTDEYLKKKDYKSIAYAFIYNIKEGLTSYESATSGTVKAKVMFFDYNIVYNSVTHKKGNVFYSKDDSKSTLMNVQNEFYMVGKEKILVSRDLKKYEVYTMEDYKKVSYAPSQYTIMGYVFNDQSITNAELVSDKDDNISIKYTLDNELATNIVKVDLKVNGGLSSYPVYERVAITLSMKRDFTPISYSIDALYEAARPIIGSTKVTQVGECKFSRINEPIVIPNESFLFEKLGADPSEIIIDDKDAKIKEDLLKSLGKLDIAHGVNISGDIKLNLFNNELDMKLEGDAVFDVSRLSKDKIFEILNFYAKAEGDATFNSLISLIKSFLGDKLGEYQALLDEFKSMEVIFDGEGSVILVPTNQKDVHPMILKAKLSDLIDLGLKNINIYNLISGVNEDRFNLKRIDGIDADNYEVEVNLNTDVLNSIKDAINGFLENPQYALVKTLLSYKAFDSIKIKIGVVDGMLKSFDASLNYVKDDDSVIALVEINLTTNNQKFDYASKLASAKELLDAYTSVEKIKNDLKYYLNNIYASKSYAADIDKLIENYNALTDLQKSFLDSSALEKLNKAKIDVTNVLAFIDIYHKYDFNNLTNEIIYQFLKEKAALGSINYVLLQKEISESDYSAISDVSSSIKYDSLLSAIAKVVDDAEETTWGLTEKEIRDIKLLIDISEYDSSVNNQIMLYLLFNGKTTSGDVFKAKVMNLYNALN